MASWAALRTFGNELRLADPYGQLFGDEVITVFSPHGAPRRAREGSIPVSAFFGPSGGALPIFGDNGEQNAYHPSVAPDYFYMFGGETEGDGDDGLFVKQAAEPEVFAAEELHNPDIEVPPSTLGDTNAQKQQNAGIVCGIGWNVGVPPGGLDAPAGSPDDGVPVPIPPAVTEPVPPAYPDAPDSIEPPSVVAPPIPPPGPVPVPLVSKALAVPGTVSALQLFLRAQGYKQDGTFVPRTFDVHTPPNNHYSVRIQMIRNSGSLTPSFQGGGPSNVGTVITASGIIEQRIAITSAHNRLVLTKDALFSGEILSVSVRWVRKRKTGAKKSLTLSNGSVTWYKRTPEEITLERCGIGNVRSDDEANMHKVQNALNDAQEWARDTGIPIKLGPKTYCVDGRPVNPTYPTGAFHIGVGDNITIEGCGKQSVLLNCKDDAYGIITIQGGNNVTLRNFTADLNCYAHPSSGSNGVLFYNRTAPMERLLVENLWVRRTDGYGVGVQSADVKSATIDGLFLEDCGADGIDFKQHILDDQGDSSRGELDRKHAILNNIHVTGFGRNIGDGGLKTGIDLRGYILASNLFIHDMKRVHDINVTGIRFNADVGSNAGRQGGRTSQVSNARVICTDPYTNQSILPGSKGRCIGMQVWAKDVNVSNFLCENAHTGIEVTPAGPEADTVINVSLSNIRIHGARGSDGTGAGIYWSGSPGNLVTSPPPLRSGYSQLGPFTLTDCDRGFEVHGPYLRGSGIIQNCQVGLYLASQEISDKTQLDILFSGNVANVSAPIAGVSHYLSRILKFTTTNAGSAANELESYLNRLHDLGGGELIIDGTHTFNSQASLNFTDNVQIVLNGRNGNPTLKAVKGPSLPVDGNPLIKLNMQTLNTGKLLINNLEIDCGDGGHNVEGGNTAGLYLQNWKTAHLYDFGGAGGDGTTGVLSYDAGSTLFTVGQNVTGQDSETVGTVVARSGTNVTGKLMLTNVHGGRFKDNELLIGGSGGLANANGQLVGNLTGNQCLSTVSIYDFLWQGGYVRHWNDTGFLPGGNATPDGLPYIARTSSFFIGDLIIGSDSGASGELIHQLINGPALTGMLYLSNIRGMFLQQEPITGLSSSLVVRGGATTSGLLAGEGGDGFAHNIRNVIFENCTNGITFKREGYSLHVENCAFRYCGSGVTTAEVSPLLGSGRTLEVGNSRFFNTTNTGAPLHARGDTRVLFHDNLIRDWGRYANGDVAPSSSIWAAVNIDGCREFVVNNNIFEMINWLPNGTHTGILARQYNSAIEPGGTGVLKYDAQTANFPNGVIVIGVTSGAQGTVTGQLDYDGTSGELYLRNVNSGTFINNEPLLGASGGMVGVGAATVDGVLTGTVHTPYGGIARGNTYRNLDYGIREVNSGANSYLDEYFDDVVDPALDADFNAGSTLRYMLQRAEHSDNDAQPLLYEQVGSMHQILSSGVYTYVGTGGFTLTAGSRVSTVRLTGNIAAVDAILTLSSLQAGNGAKFRIIRTGTGAGLWQIWDDGGPPSLLKSLIVNTWCDVVHDGIAWRLTGYGAL